MISSDTLLVLLERYTPFDEAEHAHAARARDLLAQGVLRSDRTGFDPGHVTASVFMVNESYTQSLMIFHAKFDRWLQPGGHVEAEDPTMLDAALREGAEETGLHLSPDSLSFFDLDIHAIPPRKTDPAHEHFDFRFLARVGAVEPHVSSDAAAVGWRDLDTLIATEQDAGLVRMACKARLRSEN